MNYYLKYQNQNPDELIYNINHIGYTNMNNTIFYCEEGYIFLKKLIKLNEDKILNKIKIISEDNKQKYTVQEFIDFLEKNKFKLKT